ncbi:alpha-L-rhamnosidase C-terminal domain-containing protein [Kribbella sp. NPDC050124]|uniref:alpha-L-rhamnosidase C-terminal domain-containing protein n=1 Tax=Kribbella sp. NPDC050124 TaxID=3364114 RepID=UPI003797A34C
MSAPDGTVWPQGGLTGAEDDSDVLMPELYLLSFVLRSLADSGSFADGIDIIRRFWGDIVASGSTTIWEAGVIQHGKDAFGGKGSLCHGFSTSPIDFLQRGVLGIRPLAPGFSRFAVAPWLGDISAARGDIPTPHGTIEVSWSACGDQIEGSVIVPDATIGVLPDGTELAPGSHIVAVSRTVVLASWETVTTEGRW